MKGRSIGPTVSFFAFQDIITAVVGIFILITLILVLELSQRVEAAASPPTANVDQIERTIKSLEAETQRLALEYTKRIEEQTEIVDLNEFSRASKVENLEAKIRAAVEQTATIHEQSQQIDRMIEQEEEKESALLRASEKLEGDRDRIEELNEQLADLNGTINRLNSEDGLIYRDETGDGRFLCILTLDSSGIELKDGASKLIRRFGTSDWFDAFKNWIQQSNIRSRHFLLLVRPSGAKDFDRVRDLLVQNNCVYGFDVVADDHNTQLSFQWEVQP